MNYTELVNVVNELHDTLHKIKAEHEQLREILRPAIKAAKVREDDRKLKDYSQSVYTVPFLRAMEDTDKALLRAGEVLGVE